MADAGDARALRGDPRRWRRGRRWRRSSGTCARSRSWRRWRTAGQVARLVEQGLPYLEVAQRTGASTTTVTRVAHWLRHGEGGYRLALDRLRRRRRPPDDRRPGQGAAARAVGVAARGRRPRARAARRPRARVPVPERPGRRAARARRRRARVRAGRRRRLRDHRADLVRERGADVEELLELGFGSCRLEAAVPEESRYERSRISPARRSPRSIPRLARELLPVDGRARRRHRLGRDRAAARARRRDRRPRLVGNTLRTNGLRSLGALFSSQAVLIGRRGRRRRRSSSSMMRAVVEARAHRYLMLNTPESALDARSASIIGSRSPSVLPLAEPGMVAVHALVPVGGGVAAAARARGGRRSSILVVPGRADDAMSVDRSSRTIVEDDQARRRRGGAPVGASSSTAPSRRAPSAEPDLLPREALLDLADRVRRWHEAQRPRRRLARGRARRACSSGAGCRSTRSASTCRANLVSTLVMCAVPAQAAGVERIVVCTPPAGAGLVAAAAELLGIDEVWALGGPQAIGWLAYVAQGRQDRRARATRT